MISKTSAFVASLLVLFGGAYPFENPVRAAVQTHSSKAVNQEVIIAQTRTYRAYFSESGRLVSVQEYITFEQAEAGCRNWLAGAGAGRERTCRIVTVYPAKS